MALFVVYALLTLVLIMADAFLPLDISALSVLIGSLFPSLAADSNWHPLLFQSLEKSILKSKVTSADRRAQASFYQLPRAQFISNVLTVLVVYFLARAVYRAVTSRFSLSPVFTFLSSAAGAAVYYFRALPDRKLLGNSMRIDDEAEVLRRIATSNVIAAVCGVLGLVALLGDTMDSLDSAVGVKTSSKATKSPSKKERVAADTPKSK
ncbi:hypothetical protein DFJ74DRAFT_73989 [Hyaloraphidium curvatum]|nr:hypothetical protein DFJ74DRAFT_73989 [Hyaloraphidium curvatum]